MMDLSQVKLFPMLGAFVFLLAIILGLFWSHKKRMESSKGFIEDWFVSSRAIGGFALAMMLSATYLSASSFVGGPGAAFEYGYGWVFLAATQIPSTLVTLSVLGKKYAIAARKVNAVTVVDFLKERYESKLVTVLSAFSIVIFFLATMMAQFIGGATILQSMTGLPYNVGLIIFGTAITAYVTIGGLRGVSFVNTMFGVVMTIGAVGLVSLAVIEAGGIEPITMHLKSINVGMITPIGPEGSPLNPLWILSYFVLVCFAIIGLPHVSIQGYAYKDSESLHKALIIGTIVMGWLLLSLHTLGAWGKFFVPGVGRSDQAITQLSVTLFPGWFGGFVLAAILAAALGTIDTQLLIVTGAIVKDLYGNFVNKDVSEKKVQKMVYATTIIISAIVIYATINPPNLLIWFNIFGLGGLETTFLLPFVLGLYWKRANKYGAIASIVSAMGSYIILYQRLGNSVLKVHPIVWALLIGLIAFVSVSYSTPKPPKKIIEKFWGV